ncbi:MAG: hypothetical protein JXA90_01675 [Planctomycetes bacterium]|nr:hypothetical protein [Planctomycetota bacterium]
MKICEPDPSGDRRTETDRRRTPTTLLGALRFRGRRKGFRRGGEGAGRYVDCPTREVLLLVFFIVFSSCLDAAFTLMHVQAGGAEANPFMGWILEFGIAPFLRVKMALTVLGCSLLAIHQCFPLGLWGLRALAAGYLVLLGYHGFLFAL